MKSKAHYLTLVQDAFAAVAQAWPWLALAMLLALAPRFVAAEDDDAPPAPVTDGAPVSTVAPVSTTAPVRIAAPRPAPARVVKTASTAAPVASRGVSRVEPSRVPAVNLALIKSSGSGEEAQELWSADAVGDEQAVSPAPLAGNSFSTMQPPAGAGQTARNLRPVANARIHPAELAVDQQPNAQNMLLPPPPEPVSSTPMAGILPEGNEAQPGTQLASADLNTMLQTLSQEDGASATEGASRPEQLLFEQLRKVMPGGGQGYIFERATLPDLSRLPATGWTIQYEFKLPHRGIGATPYQATVIGSNGQVMRRFSGSVEIDREAHGVQVARLVRQGETLGPTDLRELDARLSQLPRGAFDSTAAVAGSSARQELRPGQWLTEQAITATEVVKRNSAVTIKLSRGPILITAPGVALQDGTMGEVIKVANAQSKREIYARVASKDEVQVIF